MIITIRLVNVHHLTGYYLFIYVCIYLFIYFEVRWYLFLRFKLVKSIFLMPSLILNFTST